jgi:hypothetical protein
MAALPVLPAPARSRDFRLTPEQAASLSPTGLRRLLAPLAGARFAFAGPAGAGLAALGLAGILLSGGFTLTPPSATSADRSTGAGQPNVAAAAASPADATGLISAAPSVEYGMVDQSVPSAAPSAAASAGTVAVLGPAGVRPSPAPPSMISVDHPAPSAKAATTGGGGAAAVPSSDAGVAPDGSTAPQAPLTSVGAATPPQAASSTSPVAWLGVGLVLAGLALVALRWAGRRYA